MKPPSNSILLERGRGKGWLYKQDGYWVLRYRVSTFEPCFGHETYKYPVVPLGACDCRGALNQKQAIALALDQFVDPKRKRA